MVHSELLKIITFHNIQTGILVKNSLLNYVVVSDIRNTLEGLPAMVQITEKMK